MFKIVVLSGFEDIFDQFQFSVDLYTPNIHRVLVTSRSFVPTLKFPERWTVVKGVEPFVFSRNANLGILAAEDSDVLLMNDDVQFTDIGNVEILPKLACENPKIGILSPQVIGSVGTREQRNTWYNDKNPFFIKNPLRFVCVYLKRSILDEIGALDERFVGYGGDDLDYCYRVLGAGYQLAVTSSLFVTHGFESKTASASFSRTLGKLQLESQNEMQFLLKMKWKMPA